MTLKQAVEQTCYFPSSALCHNNHRLTGADVCCLLQWGNQTPRDNWYQTSPMAYTADIYWTGYNTGTESREPLEQSLRLKISQKITTTRYKTSMRLSMRIGMRLHRATTKTQFGPVIVGLHVNQLLETSEPVHSTERTAAREHPVTGADMWLVSLQTQGDSLELSELDLISTGLVPLVVGTEKSKESKINLIPAQNVCQSVKKTKQMTAENRNGRQRRRLMTHGHVPLTNSVCGCFHLTCSCHLIPHAYQ